MSPKREAPDLPRFPDLDPAGLAPNAEACVLALAAVHEVLVLILDELRRPR